jgi:hypothetical protein
MAIKTGSAYGHCCYGIQAIFYPKGHSSIDIPFGLPGGKVTPSTQKSEDPEKHLYRSKGFDIF